MDDDRRNLPAEPDRAPAEDIELARVRRRWGIAAPFVAYSVYAGAVPFGASSPAVLSFGVVCSGFLLLTLLAVAGLVAGRGQPVVRLADLPAWFTTAALVWSAAVLAATVILLAI